MSIEPPPGGTVVIPLATGEVALIDAEDAERILPHQWRLHPDGYAVRPRRAADGPGPAQIYMHRVIMEAPAGVPVRRRNESRLDNRRANLFLATEPQSWADARLRGDNTSGYRGVTWTKRGRWQAQIQVAGRRHFLGYYETKEDAARAYDAAAREAFGEFARLNLPESS
jgi:AP2 domain-containing protein